MTTTERHTDHSAPTGHASPDDVHEHKPNSFYIKVAAALAIVTGVEVGLYYLDLGKLFLPTLLVLMVVKFVTVVSLFMHLRFDNRIFSWLFYSGLFLAVFVYLAALMTFRFFDGS
ncbi:MAG: cytochrome C oxidase subunit IV family protein [Ilumatobacteraceae bacterium]